MRPNSKQLVVTAILVLLCFWCFGLASSFTAKPCLHPKPQMSPESRLLACNFTYFANPAARFSSGDATETAHIRFARSMAMIDMGQHERATLSLRDLVDESNLALAYTFTKKGKKGPELDPVAKIILGKLRQLEADSMHSKIVNYVVQSSAAKASESNQQRSK